MRCVLLAVVIFPLSLAIRVFNESIGGFNCSVIVRGSSSLQPGTVYAEQGQAVANTLYLWADWVNTTYGGIEVQVGDGFQKCAVDLLLLDDHSSTEDAVAIATDFAQQPEVDILICPYSSSLGEAVGPVSEEYEKLMVSAAAATQIFENKRFLFGFFTPGEKLLELIIRALALRGAKTFSNLREDVAYTNSVCSGIDLAITKLSGMGLQHVGDIPVPQDAQNDILEGSINQLLEMNADVVIGCTYYDVCERMLRLANEMGLEPNSYVFTACVSQPGFIGDLGYLGNFVLGAVQWDSLMEFHCQVTGWTPAEYAAIYRERYHLEPTYQATAYLGAMLAWMYSVEKIHTTNSYDVALRLAKIELETVYGVISFDENSMYSGQPAYLQHLNYTKQIVQPESLAGASMVYPMPTWTQQECVAEQGSNDCRCFTTGCPPCTREDYTYTLSDCDENAEMRVYFHLQPHLCDVHSGVDLPDSYLLSCGYLPADSVQAYTIITITTIGIMVAVSCVLSVLAHRKNKYVVAAQPLFLLLFLFGCIVVLAGNVMPIGHSSGGQCQALVWVLLIGLDVMLGAVNVKLYRIWRIFGNRRLARIKVTEVDMLRVIGAIVTFDCILIALWTALYDPVITETTKEQYDVMIESSICNFDKVPVLWGSMAFKMFMIIIACVFSHQTRNVDRKFLQSNLIMYAMYQVSVLVVIGFCVLAVIDSEANKIFVRMMVVSISTIGMIGFIVVCRLFAVYRQSSEDNSTGTGAQMTPVSASGIRKGSAESAEMSPDEFAELLFSPSALMDLHDRLNQREDENKLLKSHIATLKSETQALTQQIAEYQAYVLTGVTTQTIQAVLDGSRTSVSGLSRFSISNSSKSHS